MQGLTIRVAYRDLVACLFFFSPSLVVRRVSDWKRRKNRSRPPPIALVSEVYPIRARTTSTNRLPNHVCIFHRRSLILITNRQSPVNHQRSITTTTLGGNFATVFTLIRSMNRVFAENLVGLGFLQSVSYVKSIPSREKLFAVGKKSPQMPLLTLFFLGWP